MPKPGRRGRGLPALLGAALAACLVAAPAAPVRATLITSNWNSAISGTWSDLSNWDNGIPNNGGGNTFDAVVAAAGPAYTITLNSSNTLDALTLNNANATIDQTLNTLSTTTGATLTAGIFKLDGGTISGGTWNVAAGTLQVGASNANLISGVTINGDLNLATDSARTRIAGGTTFTTAHLGTGSTSVGFASGQTLASTILMEGAASGTRAVEMNGAAGTFTVGSTGIIRTNTGLTGDGQIGAAFWYGGQMDLTNQGLISSQTNGRTVTINSNSFTNSGTIEALSGGTLTIVPNNPWTNSARGTLHVDNATVNLEGTFDTTGGLGTINNANNGVINIMGTISNANNTITLNSNTGSWHLAGGTISGGALSFANGQTLLIDPSNVNLLTGVTVNGDLNLTTANGRTKFAGGTTFTTVHLAVGSTAVGFASGQTLSTTILLEGASSGTRAVEMNGSPGTFTIGSTGVIRTNAGLTGDGQIGGAFWYGGNMTLNNQGLISSETSGRTISIPAFNLNNSGTLQANNSSILNVSATTWSNTGNIKALNSSTANFTGTWSNAGGTVTVDANSVLTLGGSFTTPGLGTLALSPGSLVSVPGAWDNSSQSFTFNTATGSWHLAGGSITGGTLSNANGQNLLIGAFNSNLISGVTINGDLNLTTDSTRTKIAGGTTFTTAHLGTGSVALGYASGQTLASTILMEGAASGTRAVEMNGSPGTFTIGSTGVIRTNTGFGGDGQIGGPFWYGGLMDLTNQGLISSQTSGRTITINSNSFINSGTIEAISGGILTINPNNPWTNSAGGNIHVNNATVNLEGTFDTTGGIGTINNANNGVINIMGTITNTNNTLTLNSNTGSWDLNGGTISGGSLSFANGQTLLIDASNSNLLTGLTINGDLNLTTVNGRTRIAGSTIFTTAHLAAGTTSIGFAPGQTLTNTILMEGATSGTRAVELSASGTFTIGSTGVIRTNTGLGGDGQIGAPFWFNGNMTLTNNGLISSQVSGRTITINPASFNNNGTIETTTAGANLAVTTSAMTGTGTISNAGTFTLTSTSPSSATSITGSGTTVVTAGTSLSVNSLTQDTVTIQPTASVTLNANGTGTVGAFGGPGALQINAGGDMALSSASSRASRFSAVTLAGGTDAWTSRLDVNDNKLILDNANSAAAATTYTRVNNQLKQGFDNGAWDGQGIVSTKASTNVNNGIPVTIGVVNNDDGSGNPAFFTNFAGQTVNGTAVLTKYTYFGDADLSGTVDAVDYTFFVAGVQSGGSLTGWEWGDFDYSGTIDAVDYTFFVFGVQGQGAPLATGTSGSSSVPEPGSLALLGLVGMAWMLRRGRK